MGRRRFTPLIALVVLGALVLIARLFNVQVLEGGTWTAQAEALVRDGSIDPYTRGTIFDREGRVLARDIESYRIEADYRDFRRGNVLGIVAHARSTLDMRPVSLSEARQQLVPWALALGRLSARDLESFEHGQAIEIAGKSVVATAQPAAESRAPRAVDLSFYVAALFDLQSGERVKLKKLEAEQRTLAFVDRVAGLRRSSREAIERALAQRCSDELQFLADFAQLWPRETSAGDEPPLDRVLGQLENWRRQVEDGAAGNLFEAAAGFSAGRIDAACLYEFFDLDWIRRTLRWDEARLETWTQNARKDWLALRDGPMLEFAAERVRRDAASLGAVNVVLNEVAPLFAVARRESGAVQAGELPWTKSESPLVLGELATLFDVDLPAHADEAPNLPIFNADFAQQVANNPADAGVLALAEYWRSDGTPSEPLLLESASEEWRTQFAKGRPKLETLQSGFARLYLRLEDAFQSELRARLTLVREHAREGGRLAPDQKLPMAKAGINRAEERVRYILKDRGSRQFVAVARPSYELVNLLTRFPEHLRGFEVQRVHMRVNPTRDAQDRVVARLIVGSLAQPSVAHRLSQAEAEREIALLEADSGRGDEAQSRLDSLRGQRDRPDEEIGSFGLERWFEQELVGHNGYRETRGLADSERSGGARADSDKQDGRPLTTTLDALLQQDADYCLEHPDRDGSRPDLSDETWLANPAGAIVLLSPDGDVIVAASGPLVARPLQPSRSPSSDEVRERTLTKPDFQPPGSVFKPFVAAYALEHLGLDPRVLRDCSPAGNPKGNGPGYGGVRCHEAGAGHGAVDLKRAISVSCNSYFAWLGEQYDTQGLAAMAHDFGFGEPTGVRAFDDGLRSGLYEDRVGRLFVKPVTGGNLCQAGNGLSVVEATPMQIARAMAGLATGSLPTLRLVSRIGEDELKHEVRDLGISKTSLDIVRAAMLSVTQDDEGSGHLALSQEQLGYLMAAKTGSADIDNKAVDGNRVRKHTWVGGWFPAEHPIGILVVFVQDTTRTSNHGAIWIARQFLKRPAVSAWVQKQMSAQ